MEVPGIPASGPVNVDSVAHFSASSIIISVRQLVSSWARMASFPYALRTSKGLYSPFLTLATNAARGVVRIAVSAGVIGSW